MRADFEPSVAQLTVSCTFFLILALFVVSSLAGPAVTPLLAADTIELSMPLACELGRNCFIQNFVDMDAGPGRRDFTCGRATYDGHKGTDFRLISTSAVAQGIKVLAAADGVIRGRRDGMIDRLYRRADGERIKGRECGNGVVIDHGDGWQTQYCHMRRGSVRVRRGQRVRRGEPLGEVGYSGKAAFAHLHMSLRHKGKIIDPFTGRMPAGSANCARAATPDQSLWSPASRLHNYLPASQIIETAFVGASPATSPTETGLARLPGVQALSPVLLFALRLINLAQGDNLHLVLTGPGSFKVKTDRVLPRAKSAWRLFIGKRRRGAPWPRGSYRAVFELRRADRIILRASKTLELK